MTTETMSNAEQVAAGLSAEQQRALSGFTDEWQAGPNLPGHMIKAIKPGEALGLIERQFGDKGPVDFSSRGSELRAKISACWFFRLTPLGLAVREILRREA